MQSRRARIRTKLAAGLLALVLVMGAAAVVVIEQRSVLEQAFTLHDHMDHVERALLECRRQEKNFLLRGDAGSAEAFRAAFDSLGEEIVALEKEPLEREPMTTLARLAAARERYGASFSRLEVKWSSTSDLPESSPLSEEVVARARECHVLVEEIAGMAAARFRSANQATLRASVLSVVLGLLLSLALSWWLTIIITRPLELLRTVAESVQGGDIQDVDVGLADLDLTRFDSRESFELARALQRLVTSLRLLVPTERGLMSHYHMTIVVLVHRAVGPAAWGIIERARAKAGFASFSEVSPENVRRFLAELELQVAALVPEKTARLLGEAVSRLEGGPPDAAAPRGHC